VKYALPLLAVAFALVPGPRAPQAQSAGVPLAMRATVDPGVARLGQVVIYRGRVAYAATPSVPSPGGTGGSGPRVQLKWLPPENDPDLTWGAPRAHRAASASVSRAAAWDTLYVDIPFQVFKTGTRVIPGLRFQDQDPARAAIMRLPAVTMVVAPVLSAADSNADFRPARGISAPWYERVPWRWVVLILLAIAAVVVLVRWLRRRRTTAAPATAARALDPAAQALAELAALRAQQLPARGQFDAHALQLTRILRRYLEAVTPAPRPGHTTPELVAALTTSRLGPDDVQRLGALLRVWDRLKFARATSSVEEAARSEAAVEALVTQLRDAAPGRAA
jgi:hypothetical protein